MSTPQKLLTAAQLAKKLGKSKATILRWARDEIIPCERPTRQTIWFDLDAVREAIKNFNYVPK